jgi:hypothetical protein
VTDPTTAADRIADALDAIKNQKPTLWRVDVAGVAVHVHGEEAYRHLERVNQQLARMKLALHKLKWVEGSVGKVAKMGLNHD